MNWYAMHIDGFAIQASRHADTQPYAHAHAHTLACTTGDIKHVQQGTGMRRLVRWTDRIWYVILIYAPD